VTVNVEAEYAGQTGSEAFYSASSLQERALIGALLQERDAILEVGTWLLPGAFLDAKCRDAYAAILQCYKDRTPPDIATVYHGYAAIGRAEQYDPAFFAEVIAETPYGVHALQYAENVSDLARRRAYIQLGSRFTQGAFSGNYDFEAAYKSALAEIQGLRPDRRMPVPYSESIPLFEAKMEDRWSAVPEVAYRDYVITGFSELDSALDGGFAPGELIIVAARPSMGKSAFMLQLAHNAARDEMLHNPDNPRWFTIFSAEMSMEALLWRALAEVTGIEISRLKSGSLADSFKSQIRGMLRRMENMPIAIDDMSGITTDQMLDRLNRMSVERPLKAMFFDYMEKAGDGLSGGGMTNQEARVSAVSSALKHIARTKNIPVIALSQLSRAVESRADRRPQLSDLRMSGMIEANADRVMFLYREGYYVEKGLIDEPTPGKENTVDIILDKNREGQTGVFPLLFLPHITAFREIEEEDRRYENYA
jgi:replicative DNA helicase